MYSLGIFITYIAYEEEGSPHHCLVVSYAAEGSQNQLTSPTPGCIALQQVSQLWCASALGVRQVGFAHARPIMLSIALVYGENIAIPIYKVLPYLVIHPHCACALRANVKPAHCKFKGHTFSANSANASTTDHPCTSTVSTPAEPLSVWTSPHETTTTLCVFYGESYAIVYNGRVARL